MAGPTSNDLAAAVLVLAPLAYLLMGTRLWIRQHRKNWGADDWSMLITLVGWCRQQENTKLDEITKFPG